MRLKPLLRRIALLPLWPRMVVLELALFRKLHLLPPRIKGQWPPQRVLLINLTGNLGDTVMMLPTVDALRRALPQAAIDLVVAPPLVSALQSVPSLRNVFSFHAGSAAIPLLHFYVRFFRMLGFARRVLPHPYDLVLLPRWGTDPFLSGHLAAMTTAPCRCGHDPEEERGAEQVLPATTSLLTAVSRGGQGMAEGVREQLVLTVCGLAEPLNPEQEEIRPVQSVLDMIRHVDVPACLQRLGFVLDRPFILLAPGASHPARRWPAERFAALGSALHRRFGFAVYTIGGPGDHELGQHIEHLSVGIIGNLTGKTSVLEAMALTRGARLLVTNDSGPAHVGGSVGTRTLVLSVCPSTSTREHANSPLRVRPVGPRVQILQPFVSAPGCSERCLASDAHCILGLTLEHVLEHACHLLEHYPPSSESALRTERSTTAGTPAATL